MFRYKTQPNFLFLFTVLILNVLTKSSPIEKSLPASVLSDTSLVKLVTQKFDVSEMISDSEAKKIKSGVAENLRLSNESVLSEDTNQFPTNSTHSIIRNVRPGQVVHRYSVNITFDGGTFNGEVEIHVQIDPETRNDPIVFHREGLDIHKVDAGLNSIDAPEQASFELGDGIVKISPNFPSNMYVLIIEYSGEISNFGKGIFQGGFDEYQYVGMNLFPTNARRVFPCMDELQRFTTISFTFEGVPFDDIVTNSRPEDNNPNQFRDLQLPPHLWGMVSHNFNDIAIPETNVVLYGRPGLNQESLASVAINDFLTFYNQNLNKEYFQINVNQDGRMHIFALPDTNVEWYALSTICIWEPYILMTNSHSIMQRKTALVKIAEAMARQWFGYVVYPQDWKDQWVMSGLASHVAQDAVTAFQSSNDEDITLLDMNSLFTTDVIQEALLLDSYSSSVVISPDDEIFDEADIRHHILGLLKFKAPAIMRMLRLVLGDEDSDYILRAGQILLNQRTLAPTSELDFLDAVNRAWPGNDNINNIRGFLEPWVKNTGYPVLHVGWRSATVVLLTQEHFSLTDGEPVEYTIPVTFTTNQQQNYNNIYPTMMTENIEEIPLPNSLDGDDYVIFNIQGQGYYRVNYDVQHWDRIILAMDDPDRRQEIHPLNRASLIDDALNLARGNKLDYNVALRLALTWEHETEYGPWKAFVRNMEFLKHALLIFVREEGLDPDIYLRVVQRTIRTFEDEVSFSPDPSINEPAMTSLTRGIVMDHVCRSNYNPCIAAAIDWFYDTNSDEPAVNPNIPADIQPAVFCTMVREAGVEAIDLLYAYLETDISGYDRVVVLESLACSGDEDFINVLMMDTISEDGPFGSEDRSIVLAAIIRNGNEHRVINFMRLYSNDIRDMYGGPQKLEELLFVLAGNIVTEGSELAFRVWVTTNLNNLDDSKVIAERALRNAQENVEWTQRSLEEIYTWIEENDAHTVVVSFTLVFFTALLTLFNL